MTEWIDDDFRVEKKKYGLWDSYDKEGKCIVTALHEGECVHATRFILKGRQEGWDDATITYDGTVGGKL